MDGWEQVGSERPLYRRTIKVETFEFRLDVWPTNDECTEWGYGFNGKSAERFRFKTADKAMTCAEVDLAGRLRHAAKRIRQRSGQAKD